MHNQHSFQFVSDMRRVITRYLLLAAITARTLPWPRVRVAAYASVGIAVVGLTTSFFWPRSIDFSYAQATCFTNPVILPGLVKAEAGATYTASLNDTLTIGGVDLYSHTTCVVPSQAPTATTSEQVYLSPFGNSLLKKAISVRTPTLPTLASALVAPTVSPKEYAMFKLDQADDVFAYRMRINEKTVSCDKQPGNMLACGLEWAQLAQSTTYPVAVERVFRGQPGTIMYNGSLTTTDEIYVTSSTIGHGQKVFTIPENIELTLSKQVRESRDISFVRTDTGAAVPVTVAHLNTKLVVTFTEHLPRGVGYTLTLGNVIAEDGGYLNKPYSLGFTTSGGPQVAGVSIGTYKVSTSGVIRLTFDSPLAAGQNWLHYIRFTRAAGQMDTTYSVNGNVVTATIKGGMPACTAFSIEVLDGLKSNVGISGGGKTWTYHSRTLCQQSFSIGTSVRGRSITAYKFGSGTQKIIFVGNIHGNERSANYILRSFMDYLEANIGVIPAGRSVIIIPTANPDGAATGNRLNAHSVDLNRNFPANNWKSGVTEPGGDYLAYGGGTSALSEPESGAIANYILSQDPVLVMSYHAAATLVAANESGGSLSLAKSYAKKSGYPAAQGNEAAAEFDYDTTGAMEDWLHDKYNIPAILVELRNKTGNEFSAHKSAMLAMIQF